MTCTARERIPRRTRTIPELADLLGMYPRVVYALAKSNSLPVPVIRIGRKVLVPNDAIERLLSDGWAPSTTRSEPVAVEVESGDV
jgi:excisionase family DNA binding protein